MLTTNQTATFRTFIGSFSREKKLLQFLEMVPIAKPLKKLRMPEVGNFDRFLLSIHIVPDEP